MERATSPHRFAKNDSFIAHPALDSGPVCDCLTNRDLTCVERYCCPCCDDENHSCKDLQILGSSLPSSAEELGAARPATPLDFYYLRLSPATLSPTFISRYRLAAVALTTTVHVSDEFCSQSSALAQEEWSISEKSKSCPICDRSYPLGQSTPWLELSPYTSTVVVIIAAAERYRRIHLRKRNAAKSHR